MIEVTYIKILEPNNIIFGLSHDGQHDEENEITYDDNSAIDLTVDLLSRLLITQDAQLAGISVAPANGREVDEIG